MIKLVALIPLFPLLGFIINGFFGKKISKGLSGAIASIAVLASFVVALLIFFELEHSVQKSIPVPKEYRLPGRRKTVQWWCRR